MAKNSPQNSAAPSCVARGFELLSKKQIPDCASSALHFRHKKTGLEVFHLLNGDQENLFAFAFRTPNNFSNGAAHIVEHSVFCGSQKFPLKDPFINLESQSVQTFMNALTFPDKTVYPASSILEADYFNLMSVYADAVFFPLLKEEVFLQEGVRVEFAGKKNSLASSEKNCSFQGVVFNEMKGAFSSFLDVAEKQTVAALFPDTVYAKSSGGDPLEIAKLSYEEFFAFHKKFYVPQNCLVFLYGNIPTKKQLAFLQKNVLDKIESQAAQKNFQIENSQKQKKEFLLKILKSETQKPFSSPKTFFANAPYGAGETQSTAVVSWLLGNSDDMDAYAEAVFLGVLLCSHDGSPLSCELLKSRLGEDISQCSGCDASIRQISFSFGLRGVKKENCSKVKELIFRTLENLSKNGVPKSDVDSALNSIDFDNREIKRFQEPFSLVLMRRSLRTWNYCGDPFAALFVRDAFERLKSKIKKNPRFAEDLIEKYFLKNKSFVFSVITPEKKFLKNREKAEKEILFQTLKKFEKEKFEKEILALENFQKKADEDFSCLPHILPKDLKVFDEKLKIKKTKIQVAKDEVPLFASGENTNGIVYATAAFPLDIFEPAVFPYLPFFAYILNEVGWGEFSWDKASALIAKTCGAFSTTCFSSAVPKSDGAKKMLLQNRAFAGRQWLFCKIKMLEEKTQDAFCLMRDCILGANFCDRERIKTLAKEMLSEMEGAILPSGHIFASGRAECRFSRESAIQEIWGGLCQIFTLRKICFDIDGAIEKMKFIAKKIFCAGAVLHVCAEKKFLPFATKAAKKFACDLNLKFPQKKFSAKDSEFFSLLDLSKNFLQNEKVFLKDEAIFVSGLVGFCALSFPCSKYGTRNAVAEKVLAHVLTSGPLWEKIRMAFGAYGAFAVSDSIGENFTFCTYRDPSPQKSLQVFLECLEEISQKKLDLQSVEKAVTGTYSAEIQIKTPSGRGTAAFLRQLYLLSNEEKLEQTRILKTINSADLQNAAKRLLKNFKRNSVRTLILPKNSKTTSNFQKIEL